MEDFSQIIQNKTPTIKCVFLFIFFKFVLKNRIFGIEYIKYVIISYGGVYMMTNMEALAYHTIAVANSNKISITNLQVQKVMFFTLGMHIRQVNEIDDFAKEIYDLPFEKWKYGPVVETVYYELSKFKNQPITLSGKSNSKFESLTELIKALLTIDVFQLVNLSHELPSWKNFEHKIMNRDYVEPYTLEEIAGDFINV